MDDHPDSLGHLAPQQQIRVTATAATAYAQCMGLHDDDAREELAEILPLARRRPQDERGDLQQWRYRGRPHPDADRIEVQVGVAIEEHEAAIIWLRVRGGRKGDRAAQAQRRRRRQRQRDPHPHLTAWVAEGARAVGEALAIMAEHEAIEADERTVGHALGEVADQLGLERPALDELLQVIGWPAESLHREVWAAAER